MNVEIDMNEHSDYVLSQYKPREEETHRYFSIDEPEFDMSTYKGRFMKNRQFCNPLIAFYSNSRISEMQQLIEKQRSREEESF